ncbi:MAG: sulfurtransferase TusA family protein [Caldiserica bacterium]|nr:sulfurtransferase TusA family protein [Caldisericota bacterium]MDH7562656.1 sulfurtransferase TusA family protein [Caldisericota bacterium]
MEFTRELNAVGLSCPIPIIKTKKAMDELKEGEVLLVLADDPGAREDFPAWCEQTGNELLKMEEEGKVIKIFIKKG